MKFYKITNEEENHNGMQYHDGLNTDILPFNPSGDCESGGIYFAREDILEFLSYGVWIREVTIPAGEKVYENPSNPKKWKAHSVWLGPRRRIDVGNQDHDAEIYFNLIEEGAKIPAADRSAILKNVGESGNIDRAELLLKRKVPIDYNGSVLLIEAVKNGHTDLIKWFANKVPNHDWRSDRAIEDAIKAKQIDAARCLADCGYNVPNMGVAGIPLYLELCMRWLIGGFKRLFK